MEQIFGFHSVQRKTLEKIAKNLSENVKGACALKLKPDGRADGGGHLLDSVTSRQESVVRVEALGNLSTESEDLEVDGRQSNGATAGKFGLGRLWRA